MKIGDEINLVIGFVNDSLQIEKENIYVFNNIKIKIQLLENHFETEKIKVKPINSFYGESERIDRDGCMFEIDPSKPDLINYDQANNAYIMFSETISGKELLIEFLRLYISYIEEKIEFKEKQILGFQKELNGLEIFLLTKETEE